MLSIIKGQNTYAPFHPALQEMMRHRSYSVTVSYPDGSVKTYESMGHFAHCFGKRLEHVRRRAVFAEMELGDSAHTSWVNQADEKTYHFTFTRIR